MQAAWFDGRNFVHLFGSYILGMFLDYRKVLILVELIQMINLLNEAGKNQRFVIFASNVIYLSSIETVESICFYFIQVLLPQLAAHVSLR